MGSLRNPIGPLPSSIYWRRRAVVLCLIALLALLAAWALSGPGSGGRDNSAGGSDGKGPAPSITPGESGSGPAISDAPGGRDEAGSGSGSGSGSGGGAGGGSGSGGGADSGASGGSSSGSGSGSGSRSGAGGGSGDGGSGSGTRLPSGSSLPNCTPSSVKLSLRSKKNAYEPGEKPTLELIAENTSGADCKVDLGPKKTVLTITQAEVDDEMWSSEDCPSGPGSLLLRVPAGEQITHPVKWDRKASEPQCATPAPGSAKPGTYLAEAKAAGFPAVQASFVLEES
ncbi:hypothetical protein [Streptomyces sp. NPDC002851]